MRTCKPSGPRATPSSRCASPTSAASTGATSRTPSRTSCPTAGSSMPEVRSNPRWRDCASFAKDTSSKVSPRMTMDECNDPKLRSFVSVGAESHFPIQNLPFGTFASPGRELEPCIGVAIGELVLDVTGLAQHGLLGPTLARYVRPRYGLNDLMAAGRERWREVRTLVSRLLRQENPTLRDNRALRDQVLIPQAEVAMELPAEIGNYTDFYSSREHATNVGTMLRGADNALQANWLHLPVAYHGRSSSVIVSGTDLRRPHGQTKPADATGPVFGPSKSVDFELEMGAFVGPGNDLGR